MALRIRRILILVVIMLLACNQALAGSIACYINANTKIYQKPSSSARTMNVGKNLSVTMTDCTSTWARIERKGYVAYIPLKYITLKDRLEGYTTRDIYLYKSTSTSSEKVCGLKKGQKVYITGRDGDYFRVESQGGGTRGYVPVRYVSSSKPASSTPSAPSGGDKAAYVAQLARSFEGCPYESSPNPPKSFDCSNFVKYCFAQVKVSLLASAQRQGYEGGYAFISSASELRVGDVVCFNTNDSDDDLSDHTGIYLGGGQFVHASSAAGKVIVSTLASGYYKETFSWGRRILG